MPYKIYKTGDEFCAFKHEGGKKGAKVGCSKTMAEASKYLRALYAHAPDTGGKSTDAVKSASLTALVENVRTAFYARFNPDGTVSGEGVNRPWVREVFDDNVVAEVGAELFEYPWSYDENANIVFGDPAKVEIVYRPAKSLVFKDSQGEWRWFGWCSNGFRDRDSPPEIISSKAHSEYVDHATKEGSYPELWVWHVPGSRVGMADWLDYSDGFLLSSGTFDADKSDVAERLAGSKESWTMSHQFRRLAFDPKSVTTDQYRQIEQSITPEGVEANQLTRFATFREVMMPLAKEKREKLVSLLGEARVTDIEAQTATLRKAAEDAGIEFKDLAAEPAPAAPATTDGTTPAAAVPADAAAPAATPDLDALTNRVLQAIMDKLAVKALSDTVTGLDGRIAAIEPLVAKVTTLETALAAMKQTDDAKVAAALTPKAVEWQPSWATKGASKSAETALKDGDATDESLKTAGPSKLEAFLSRVTAVR